MSEALDRIKNKIASNLGYIYDGEFSGGPCENDIPNIIDALIPLYAQGEDDLPNQALWHHPDIEKIHTIQSQLINLLFPGRSIGETQPLEAFFETQLTQLMPL